MMGRLTLVQLFNEPINGYFDGGPRKEFHWFIESWRRQGHDRYGDFVRVGSWEANHWFHVAKGKTDKLTLANVRRALSVRAKKLGLVCTFEYRTVAD